MPLYATVLNTYTTYALGTPSKSRRLPAYVHTLAYTRTIRSSVTGPLGVSTSTAKAMYTIHVAQFRGIEGGEE